MKTCWKTCLNSNVMKYKTLLFWTIIYCALFVFLEYISKFHFYFYEQKYLFLFSGDYACEQLTKLGGVGDYLAAFFGQFFILPYAGSAITAALLTATGYLTQVLVKSIAPHTQSFFLYLLPPVSLLFMHFEYNYLLQGTIAYLFMLGGLCIYVRIKQLEKRLIYGVIFLSLLYLATGAIASLFAVTCCVWEWLHRQRGSYWSLLLLLQAVVISVATVYFSYVGEFRLVFLPDAYYHFKLTPPKGIYFSWLALPAIVLFACRAWKKTLGGTSLYVWYSIQVVFIAGLLYWGVPKYADKKSVKMKELDYYTRAEQWDKVIESCKGPMTNYLYMNYLNLALARQEMLAEQMFAFDQRGPLGLMVNWNKTSHISALLNDIYFSMGAVALSQEMAFEGNVGADNPRLLKRLVETNLIFGAYAVAEKYISILEQTFYYGDWARKQRTLLYNDEAVNTDPLLGAKRKCLPSQNSLAQLNGLDKDLMAIAEMNPEHRASVQYLGASYLLQKDINSFKAMIEKYYKTEVLPVLPISFQEAIIVYSEANPDYWKQYGVSGAVIERYRAYKQMLLRNKGRSNIKALMFQSYGNTFWYYLMFK